MTEIADLLHHHCSGDEDCANGGCKECPHLEECQKLSIPPEEDEQNLEAPDCPEGQKKKGCISCKFYNWCPNSGDSPERREFQSFGAGCCGFSEEKLLCRNPDGIFCTLKKRREYRCPIRREGEPPANPSWDEMLERKKKGLHPRTGRKQKISQCEVSPRHFCDNKCPVKHCTAQYSYAGCREKEAAATMPESCHESTDPVEPVQKGKKPRQKKYPYRIRIYYTTPGTPAHDDCKCKYIAGAGKSIGDCSGGGGPYKDREEVITSILNGMDRWKEFDSILGRTPDPVNTKTVLFEDETGEFSISDFFSENGLPRPPVPGKKSSPKKKEKPESPPKRQKKEKPDHICEDCRERYGKPIPGYVCLSCKEDQKTKGRRAWITDLRLGTVHLGDMNVLGKQIPSESVDVIFTDPVYLKEFYQQAYADLAQLAYRVLKPHGFLFTYAPQTHLDEIMDLIKYSSGGPAKLKLHYFWIIESLNSGKSTAKNHQRNAICLHKPILVFQKSDDPDDLVGARKCFADVVRGLRQKKFHPWQQSVHDVLGIISRFMVPGEILLDPYAGTGTSLIAGQLLGMEVIGFEIDPDTHAIAVREMQQKPIGLFTFGGEEPEIPPAREIPEEKDISKQSTIDPQITKPRETGKHLAEIERSAKQARPVELKTACLRCKVRDGCTTHDPYINCKKIEAERIAAAAKEPEPPQELCEVCRDCDVLDKCIRKDPYGGCHDAVLAIDKAVQEKEEVEPATPEAKPLTCSFKTISEMHSSPGKIVPHIWHIALNPLNDKVFINSRTLKGVKKSDPPRLACEAAGVSCENCGAYSVSGKKTTEAPQKLRRQACYDCESSKACGRHDPYGGCERELLEGKKPAKKSPRSAGAGTGGGPQPFVQHCCGTCGHHKGRKTFHETCPRLGELLFKGGTKSATVLMEETQRERCGHWIMKNPCAACDDQCGNAFIPGNPCRNELTKIEKKPEKKKPEPDEDVKPNLCENCSFLHCTVFDSTSPECRLLHPDLKEKEKEGPEEFANRINAKRCSCPGWHWEVWRHILKTGEEDLVDGHDTEKKAKGIAKDLSVKSGTKWCEYEVRKCPETCDLVRSMSCTSETVAACIASGKIPHYAVCTASGEGTEAWKQKQKPEKKSASKKSKTGVSK